MRISKEKAAANRRAIISAAGKLFREQGYEAVGLNDLMQEAGFTRGGFYNHFSSKDELAEEVCRETFDEYTKGLIEAFEAPGNSSISFVDVLAQYLSTQHRDNPGSGCPTAALAIDAIRQGPLVQRAFSEGLEQYISVLCTQFARLGATSEHSRTYAIDLLCRVTGAVTLSRAIVKHDAVFSEEILNIALTSFSDVGRKSAALPKP